jgi:AraC-like DNA-binding protein
VIRYREIRPSARLRPFVHTFWILEHDGEEGVQRVVPDGHSELILNWGQPFEAFEDGRWRGQPRCFFAGQIDGPLLLRPAGPAKMLGIGFQPYGAASVFAPPMHELSGRFTPVEDLSRQLSRELNDALDSPDPIGAVESALLSAENKVYGGDLLIAEAARRFLAAVGLSPKLFCRIQRFNNVFHVLGQPSCNWVETAVACGYYDQAHLIRDCKDLSGNTPAMLLSEDADLARHFYGRYGVSHSSNTATRVSV